MDQKPYPAEKARGGEIVLNTPLRRVIFLAGLIGTLVLVVAIMLFRFVSLTPVHFAMHRNDPRAVLFV